MNKRTEQDGRDAPPAFFVLWRNGETGWARRDFGRLRLILFCWEGVRDGLAKATKEKYKPISLYRYLYIYLYLFRLGKCPINVVKMSYVGWENVLSTL